MTSSSERAGLEPAQVEASRRAFLQRLCLGLGALCGALLGAPIIVFFLGPLIRQPAEAWRPVGKVGRFRVGEVAKVDFVNTSPLPWSGQAARSAAWLQRLDADRFRAFAVNCTHLGCPVDWRPGPGLYFCPCHGGVYFKDGTVAAGPPPRPLPQYPVRVRNGRVEIRTSPIPITTSITK